MLIQWVFRSLLAILALVLAGGLVLYIWGGSAGWPQSAYVTETKYRAPQYPTGDTLTIMTFNVGWLSGMTNNRPLPRTDSMYAAHLTHCVKVFQNRRPDIIGLQEIDYYAARSKYWTQQDTLAALVPFAYGARAVNWDKQYVPFPYWPVRHHFGRLVSGQSVLSQMPIIQARSIILPDPPAPFYYQRFYINRAIQQVDFTWADTTIVVLNVHLEAWHLPTRTVHGRIVAALADSLRAHHPVIVLGDFNAEPPQKDPEDSTLVFLQRKGFIPAAWSFEALSNWPATYSSASPQASIDHIFIHPSQWEVVDAQVVTAMGDVSDHLPLMSRLCPRFAVQQDSSIARTPKVLP